MRKLFFSLSIVLSIAVISCAKRGNITGGLKDSLPPVLRSSQPVNGATNFNGNEIKLYFNEYVKLKNVGKQLIVSPFMEKKPEVFPMSSSKVITIKLKDTLKPNTTYSFNFGQSIEDNNESNVLNQFKYVFSTGSYVDSLAIGVKVKDAIDLKTAPFVSIMLYEINEKYNDSTIYKQTPMYIANTLEGNNAAKLENLRQGKYRLVAIKDNNNNNKFDTKSDKIGYINEVISVPNDTVFELELFKEELPFKTYKPSQVSGNRMVVAYDGNPKGIEVGATRNGNFVPSMITQMANTDSLQIWFPPIKNDSLSITLSKNNYKANYVVKIKDQKKDSLSFTSSTAGDLAFRKKFKIKSNTPLVTLNNSKINFTDKDSLKVRFTTEYEHSTQEVVFNFEKEPLQKYKIQLLPGALTDFYEKKNDTLTYQFSTRNTSDYGNLRVPLENISRYPLIVEITDDKGIVIEREIVENGNKVFFDLIEPKKYTLRVIYDDNKNGVWDPGNYIDKRQSEEVIYFPKEIDVRSNWDVEQPFDLSK